MELSSISSSYQAIQQTTQKQRSEALSSSELASKIIESNDLDSNGPISSSELGIQVSPPPPNLQSQESSSLDATSQTDLIEESSEDAPPPPPPLSSGGGESEEEYDDADLNQDGTVSAVEQAIYDGEATSSSMQEHTLDLVSTLITALKDENTQNGSDLEIELSQFKGVMSMVNEQLQDKKTKENLDKYLDYLLS